MKLALGLLTLAAVLIAYSAAKNFWSGPIEIIKEQVSKEGKAVSLNPDGTTPDSAAVGTTPVPTPTPTTTTTTSTLVPCVNGCILSVGTANAPTAPPPINTNYNGRNPLITSYPTTQP